MTDKELSTTTPIRVVFRKWNNEVIALFPEEISDCFPDHCESYMHVGQHGSAKCQEIINNSTLATPEEYQDLKVELESIGYKLTILKRVSPQCHLKRYEAIKEYLKG